MKKASAVGSYVLVKGGTRAVKTDADGSFELKLNVPNVILEIS